MQNTQFVQ